MSKFVEFLYNMYNFDVLLEIKCIIELCNLSMQEIVCKLRGVLERCGEYMEVKGEKIIKVNIERIN